MNRSDAKVKPSFISRFRLDERVLQRSDPKHGRASVTGAVEKATGNRVIIKQWRRNSDTAGPALHEIWRQELRQLHRLAGYPGARQYIVPLLDSSEEEDGFFLVLGSGQRFPLQVVMDDAGENHWLKQPRLEKSRLTIWSNLLRISCGLNLLHMQGLLHRNLDTMAIYTSGEDTPDFQLSGFEWSIRLSSSIRNSPLPSSAIAGNKYVHSFLQDWHAFGVVAATLLGLDSKTFLGRRTKDGRDVAYFLSGIERDLLLLLLRADPFSRIDGETVNSKISTILSSLQTIITKRDDRLYMTPNLGQDSELSKAIREASKRAIAIADVQGQIEFIKGDLSESPQFVFSTTYGGAGAQQYFLFGRQLNYRLTPYRHSVGGRRSDPTWGVASCDGVAVKRPTASDIVAYKTLPNNCIEVIPLTEITRKFVTLQGRTTRWDKYLDMPENGVSSSDDSRQYRAVLLVQVLESLLIASEIWPVEIHSFDEAEGINRLQLKYRKDEEREKLSSALGLRQMSARMKESFGAEQWQTEDRWKLTDVGVLGEHDSDKSDWDFVEALEVPKHGVVYQFEGTGMRPLGDRLFLRRSSYVGTDKLLNRRATALMALRDHSELLNALRDPAGVVRPTHETLTTDAEFAALDESKQNALSEIWASIPLFLLQGPPGVGKTRLVRELVRRRLSEDPSARILLSAQSHDAVDHLLHEIEKDISSLSDHPIVIRSKPRDDKREPTVFDLPEQAKALAERIVGSELVKRLPAKLKAKIDALLPVPTNTKTDENDSANKNLTRSLEALLLRGANLVFSSTNARDLERLLDEKSQFDWSIIEEAGKAMGPELLAPLLLSHRRLMIGDHKQLPPFGANDIKKLLSRPVDVGHALMIGESLVSWVFREAGLEEIVDQAAKTDEFTAVCGEAAAALMLFETLVTENLQPAEAGALATARQLLFQHRMHPAIARLVADSFYALDDLKTHPDCITRFKTEAVPYAIIDPARLPASPIVFVNMPFVQSTIGRQEIEKKPRYHNVEEADAVIQILSLIRAVDGPRRPSIAVLTPYREQMRRLKTRIQQERKGRLAHLKDFLFESDGDTPVGTVDSFQGNEADIVVVSLVRNNAHSGMRGLGFLADPRRMNVLLSRARSKLIIVGSHEFLTSRFVLAEQGFGTELEFLKRVLDSLQAQTKTTFIAGIPDVKFVDCAMIFGGQK
jgi:serine/threonine protein kinase